MHTKKALPFIPKPQKKEHPVVEELVTEPKKVIPVPLKQDIPMMIPNYNDLYDTFRSKSSWRYTSDAYATGVVTTIAATTVNSTVDLTVPANTQGNIWRLEQWPGGTLLYLVVRFFSFGPQTATFATQGEITTTFIDQFGNTTPLGILPNNAFSSFSSTTVLPGGLTDSGQQKGLGQLSFALNTGATVGTYAWQLGFSAAYLLPAVKGYNLKRIGDHDQSLHSNHLYD